MDLFDPVRRPGALLSARAIVYAAVVTAVVVSLIGATLGDVDVYWRAGHAVLADEQVYGWLINHHGFLYPPFAALLMSSWSDASALVMWCSLNVLSIGALVVVLRLVAAADLAAVRCGDRRAALRVSTLVLALPVTETIRYGQVALILAALVLLDLLVLRRGVLIGLAVAVKLTPALFVLHLLLQRRFREVGTATAVFAATVGLSWLLLPDASARYWLHGAVTGIGTGGFGSSNNRSLYGLLLHLAGPGAGTAGWLLLAAPATVAGLWLAHRVARNDAPVLAAGIIGVTSCLVSPLSWNHHWVWALPALAGLWSGSGRDSPAFLRWTGLLAVYLAAASLVPASGAGLVPLALGSAVWKTAAMRRAACARRPVEGGNAEGRAVSGDPGFDRAAA